MRDFWFDLAASVTADASHAFARNRKAGASDWRKITAPSDAARPSQSGKSIAKALSGLIRV